MKKIDNKDNNDKYLYNIGYSYISQELEEVGRNILIMIIIVIVALYFVLVLHSIQNVFFAVLLVVTCLMFFYIKTSINKMRINILKKKLRDDKNYIRKQVKETRFIKIKQSLKYKCRINKYNIGVVWNVQTKDNEEFLYLEVDENDKKILDRNVRINYYEQSRVIESIDVLDNSVKSDDDYTRRKYNNAGNI